MWIRSAHNDICPGGTRRRHAAPVGTRTTPSYEPTGENHHDQSRRAVGNTLAEDPATVVPATGPLTDLVAAVRHVIGMRADWARTADLVADQLRAHLPSPEVSGFAPPGDIHRIRNDGSETAISLHI